STGGGSYDSVMTSFPFVPLTVNGAVASIRRRPSIASMTAASGRRVGRVRGCELCRRNGARGFIGSPPKGVKVPDLLTRRGYPVGGGRNACPVQGSAGLSGVPCGGPPCYRRRGSSNWTPGALRTRKEDSHGPSTEERRP